MATVIDALVVTLGLDASKYKQGQKDTEAALKATKDEAARTAKELESRGKQAASFFGQVKTQVVGMLAAFTGGAGIAGFVTSIVGSDAALGRLAATVSMSTGKLSAWQGVAERSGGSSGGMAATFQHISEEMQNLALHGQSALLVPLAFAKINPGSFIKADQSERLMMLADAVKGMDPAKAHAVLAPFADPDTINVIMKGRAALTAMLAEQEKIGHTNEADAASAQRLQSAWAALGQATTDLGRKILTAAAPTIEAFSAVLLRLSEWAATHRPMVEATFYGLAAAVTAFTVVLAAPLAGVLAMAAGIGIAVAAIAVLYADWKSWVSGGKSAFGGFWQFLADSWAGLAGTVGAALTACKALFTDFGTVISAGAHLITALFTGTSGDIRAAWQALWDAMGQALTEFTALWKGFGGKIVEMVENLGPAILNAFKSAFTGALGWVEGRLHSIWSAITGKNVDPVTPDAAAGGAAADAPGGEGWFSRMKQHLGLGSDAPVKTQPSGGTADAAQMKTMLNQAMDEQGITDPSLRAGIAAVNEGESGFKPRTESDYSTTSNARLRSIFSTATGGMSDDALSKLKGDPRAFFNKIYGGNAALGNQGGDDGYNYRGRGLNQLTGRANYKKYGDKIGVDLLSNPDLANDPKVAASLSVAYMKDRYKGGGFAGMKAAVGNSIGAPNAVKDQAYAAYMQSGQFSGMRPDPSLATGASARMAGNQAGGSSTEVHIASVTVNTRATDAAGVAKDFHAEVRKQYAYASQANYGLA